MLKDIEVLSSIYERHGFVKKTYENIPNLKQYKRGVDDVALKKML